MISAKRRWVRLTFSLRTLFLALTLVAALSAWVAYNLNWIRLRHALLEKPNVQAWGNPADDPFGEPMEVDAPWPLTLFGESGLTGIWLIDATDSDRAAASRLFPEASVTISAATEIRDTPKAPMMGSGDSLGPWQPAQSPLIH